MELPGWNEMAPVWKIGDGDHVDHAGRRQRGCRGDAGETRMRERAARDEGVHHSRPLEVCDEGSFAAHQGPVFFAQRRRADAVKRHGHDRIRGRAHPACRRRQ